MKNSKLLTPDQYAFAQSVATMRAENKLLNNRVAALTRDYDELWKVFICFLHACDEHELRMHKSNMLRFKESYRVDRWYDEETEEYVWKLKGLTDDDAIQDSPDD